MPTPMPDTRSTLKTSRPQSPATRNTASPLTLRTLSLMLGGHPRRAIGRSARLARDVPEWWGKTDDTPIPPRVKLRVAARANNCCEACGNRIRFGGEIDHTIALINGGEHRERNLRLLCPACHKIKSGRDVAEKSKTAAAQRKLGPIKREQSAWSKRYHAAKQKYGLDPWRR